MGPESKKPYSTEVYKQPASFEQQKTYSYVQKATESLGRSQNNIDDQLKGMMSALDKNFESQDLGLMGVDTKNQQKFATFLTKNKIDLNEWNKMKPEEQKKYLDGFAKTGEGSGKTEGQGGGTEQKKENAMLHSSSSGMEKYNTFNKGYYSQAQIDAMKAKEAQASQKKVDSAIQTAENKTAYNANFAEFKANDSMTNMALNMLGDKPKTDQGKTETGKYEISKDQIKAGDQMQKIANDLKKGKTETKTDASKDKKETNQPEQKQEGKKQEGRTDGTEKKTNVTPKTVEQRIKEMEKSMNLSEDEKKKMAGMDAKNVNALQYDMNYYLEKNKNATQEEKDAYKGHLMRKYGAESGEKKDEKLPEKKEDQKVKEGNNTGTDKGTSGQGGVESVQGYKQEDVTNYKKMENGGYQITTKDGKVHNLTEQQAMNYYVSLDEKQKAELQKKIQNNNAGNETKDSNSNVSMG